MDVKDINRTRGSTVYWTAASRLADSIDVNQEWDSVGHQYP